MENMQVQCTVTNGFFHRGEVFKANAIQTGDAIEYVVQTAKPSGDEFVNFTEKEFRACFKVIRHQNQAGRKTYGGFAVSEGVKKLLGEAFGVDRSDPLTIAVFQALDNSVKNDYEDFAMNTLDRTVAADLYDNDVDIQRLVGDELTTEQEEKLIERIFQWRMLFAKKMRRKSGHTGKVDRGPLPGALPGT